MAFTKEQTEIIQATAHIVGRSGATHFELGWEHDDVPVQLMGWYAQASYESEKLRVPGDGPVEACDALARRVLDGGLCMYCKRTVTLDDLDDLSKCFRSRVGNKWLRGCEVEYPEDGPVPTTRKLALALLEAGAPGNMIEATLNGYFDEYKSELALPLLQLVSDCQMLHEKTGNEKFLEIAERTKNGDFDATKEESDVYWQSDEGKQIMAEFGEEIMSKFTKPAEPGSQNRAERRRAERDAKKQKRR